jgi:hypothetical protein
MEFTGAYHKRYITQLQSDRKKERDKFIADTARMLFVSMHAKLDFDAPADDYKKALDIALDNAKKLGFTFFPDLTDKELEAAWKKVIEPG